MPPIDVVTKRVPRHFSPAKYAQKICQSRFWAEIVATAWQLIEEQEKFTLLEIATAAESAGPSTRSRRWQGVRH